MGGRSERPHARQARPLHSSPPLPTPHPRPPAPQFIKLNTLFREDKQVKALGFRRAALGDERYEQVGGFDIGDGIRASGSLGADRHERPLIDVAEFEMVRET